MGKKQEGSDLARYFYLFKESSGREVILLDSGDLNFWASSGTSCAGAGQATQLFCGSVYSFKIDLGDWRLICLAEERYFED